VSQEARNEWDEVFESVGYAHKNNESDPEGGQVLLVGQLLVSGDKNVVLRLRRFQEGSVLQSVPGSVMN